jgi:hypothetical protein
VGAGLRFATVVGTVSASFPTAGSSKMHGERLSPSDVDGVWPDFLGQQVGAGVGVARILFIAFGGTSRSEGIY